MIDRNYFAQRHGSAEPLIGPLTSIRIGRNIINGGASCCQRRNMPKVATFSSPTKPAAAAVIDIVLAPGFISHLEHMWEDTRHARFFHGLELFARLIRFDKRGTGLSDRSVGFPTLEVEN